MARKKAEPAAEQPREKVTKLITAAALKSLLSSAQKAREDVTEITGALGEEIKTAIEKKHLHRGAFNAIKGLSGKSAEKLREFKDHFDYYWEASGLEKKANSAMRMDLGDEVGADDDEVDDGNIARFPHAAE